MDDELPLDQAEIFWRKVRHILGWGCLLFFLWALFLSFIGPLFVRKSRSPDNQCIANLKQLDAAKEQWALENRKTPTNTPVWNEIIGTNAYIKNTPRCPRGGTYKLNRIDFPPTCSLGMNVTPAHVLPQ